MIIALRQESNDWVSTLGQVLLCSLLIALCAQIRIPLPFSPIPITMQTFGIMVIGAMLGAKNGSLCVLMYLTEASFGLPVLRGGVSDPLALVGPTAGYLIGFIFVAYISGWAFEKNRNIWTVLTALACAESINLCLGALWLSLFVGINQVWLMGVLPFLPGAIFKILSTTFLFRAKVTGERAV